MSVAIKYPRGEIESVVACHLGRMEYAPARALQQRLQQRLIGAKRQGTSRAVEAERAPHVLLLVEHPPVYTLGKSGNADHLLLSREALAERGAQFYHVGRGGDITFHGPGQLVVYPILDLDRIFRDLHRYLRTLEEVVIRTCASYDLPAGRVEGRTGVWIGPDERGAERKICAMGVRCSRWVTMHGLAFNLNTDLAFFDAIVPCGIADREVTSLQQELDRPIEPAAAEEVFLTHFADCFAANLRRTEGPEAQTFLKRFLQETEAPA